MGNMFRQNNQEEIAPNEREAREREIIMRALQNSAQASNYAGNPTNNLRPIAPPPPVVSQTKAIKNDVNIDKNSICLLKNYEEENAQQIKFNFDANTDCLVTVWIAATEVPNEQGEPQQQINADKHPAPNSYKFSQGYKMKFPDHLVTFFPDKYDNDILFDQNVDEGRWPLIINIKALQPTNEHKIGSQCTYCLFEKNINNNEQSVKVLQQKIHIDGHTQEVFEIYGIQDSTSNQNIGLENNEQEPENKECVICMGNERDTTVLPCRHMCVCSECAQQLRFQTNKCPICRTNIESLLQIKVENEDTEN